MLDPARWNALVARRPDLDVTDSADHHWTLTFDRYLGWKWVNGPTSGPCMPTQYAEALIFRKLVEALPEEVSFWSEDGSFMVGGYVDGQGPMHVMSAKDSIEVLLNYYEQP